MIGIFTVTVAVAVAAFSLDCIRGNCDGKHDRREGFGAQATIVRLRQGEDESASLRHGELEAHGGQRVDKVTHDAVVVHRHWLVQQERRRRRRQEARGTSASSSSILLSPCVVLLLRLILLLLILLSMTTFVVVRVACLCHFVDVAFVAHVGCHVQFIDVVG